MTKDPFKDKPELKKAQSLPLSIWHWSNMLAIALILITVLLVKTIFSSKENTPVILETLTKKGTTVTFEQAKAVAKLYSHKLWDWHVYFGYALTGLFIFRIVLEFFQLADQKLFKTIKNAKNYLRETSDKKSVKHVIIVKYIYVFFYLVLTLMIITGLFIKFSDDNKNLKEMKDFAKDIHNIGMYIILSFIVFHLFGLLFWELKKKRIASSQNEAS